MSRFSTIASLFLLPFAVVGAQHLFRRPPVRSIRGTEGPLPPAVADPHFRETMELYARAPLLAGNHVEVLRNGDETFPRLFADLRAAEHSIVFQVYYAKPGRLADQLKEVLLERAGAGVRVLFLVDAFGGQDLTEGYLQELRDGGVEVGSLRPLQLGRLWEVPHRSHARAVVIDGRIGYTGGFGLDDKWLGSGRQAGEWRETNVRLEGPAARQFEAAFALGWVDATRELITGERFFPDLASAGDVCAGLLHTSPEIGSTTAERFLALSISAARERLWIANSYFVPDPFFTRLLVGAARRGVDVRVLTASRHATDVKFVHYAGRERYSELLRGGVRIFEYLPAMMHAKTFVVDGHWCTVGAMNFDNRSLALLDETTLAVLDRGVGRDLERIFREDLQYAEEITLRRYRERPRSQKLLERGAALFRRQL